MPKKKGNISKLVYFSPAEWTAVLRKAKAAGMRPGTYIRIMSVQGEIKFYDNENYKMLINAVRSVSNSMNQIAKVANSTGSAVLEELDNDQTEMTCEAFRKYICDTVATNRNLALGVRAALIRALEETLDYLGEPEEPDEDEEDFEEYDSDIAYINTLRSELDITKRMEVAS